MSNPWKEAALIDVQERNEAVTERDRMIRLFNRLEAAVSHHKKAHECGDAFVEDADEALWKVRDKILRDYAERKG